MKGLPFPPIWLSWDPRRVGQAIQASQAALSTVTVEEADRAHPTEIGQTVSGSRTVTG